MSIDFHSAIKTPHPNHFIGFHAFLCPVFMSKSDVLKFSDSKLNVQTIQITNTSTTEKNINRYLLSPTFTSGLGNEIVRFSTKFHQNIKPETEHLRD